MVNSTSSKSALTQYALVEQSLVSKTINEEDCEDEIYTGSHFFAVIDGATSKTERRWDGKTGGRAAAQLIKGTLSQIPYDATHVDAFETITSAIQQFYIAHDALESVTAQPVQRLTASMVIVSLFRQEVWFVGDCQCLLDYLHIWPEKMIDTIASEARAMFLETEILRGATIEELLKDDTGRAFILPLLERQSQFQNNPHAGKYEYITVDGFPIPVDKIQVEEIPLGTKTLALASDGYPHLKDTLAETEQMLHEVLREDPLLFRKYKSTKGMKEGNVSFDDRAYLKLSLTVPSVPS